MYKTCRIEFQYDEDLARAVAHHYGDERLATHEEMRVWFRAYGESADDDILFEMQADDR